MDASRLSGSCLCGKVKYSVATEIKDFYFCHCEQCRKITGSAFTENIPTNPVTVSWVSGYEWVKRFDYPEERVFTKVFCTNCGSGLPFLNKKGDVLVIPSGSLDQHLNIKSKHNIFWADKASWYEAGVTAPKCAGIAE